MIDILEFSIEEIEEFKEYLLEKFNRINDDCQKKQTEIEYES